MPGEVDVRANLSTDTLLSFVELGATVDVGAVRIGPGTLAMGAEASWGVCVSYCLGLKYLTGKNHGASRFAPLVRVGYHLEVPGKKRRDDVDLYAVVFGGPIWVGLDIDEPGGGSIAELRDRSFVVGGGMGAKFFFTQSLFFGGEARVRYGQGRYAVTVGQYTPREEEASWTVTGIGVVFFAGVRL